MSNAAIISGIRSKYLLLRWVETILFGLSAAAIVGAVCILFNISIAIALPAALATIAWRYYALSLSKVDNLRVALYLNRFYPELKESTDLLVKDPQSLSTLEQIQLARIDISLANQESKIALPHNLFQSATLLATASLVFFLSTTIGPLSHRRSTQNAQSEINNSKSDPPNPSIKSSVVTISPPLYTRLPKTETNQLSFSTIEGSTVTWRFSFHHPVEHAKLTMTGGDSLTFTQRSAPGTTDIEFKYSLTTSVLYRISWTISGETHSSDYYRIDVKPDQVPQVAINDLPQFTRLKWGEKNTVDIVSRVTDDYGLTEAHVVATVSKGSGESVKFREEKLPFVSPSKVSGTSITGKLSLDFRKLGMDPGDEVYFYVEAYDNKQPHPQRNRTDTYFVSLQDTAHQDMVMDEGLGVDLMPDYFRSQRQLIIDTEKLLADQKAKKVTNQKFKATSNELGYDQKVLRLRYGQFLGEEFETNIGESAAEHVEHEENEKQEADDILKQFGHQHDTENEHNLVPDKKEKDKDDPMAAFRHDHDSEDQATFFTQSIKAKLRAALTLMWDSELKLRMYQSKESLPTQYQILKLLKEISQDSRIYVHRMGFDPPPLKEEKRLTASLEEVRPAGIENKTTDSYQLPAMRTALSDISTALLDENILLNDQQRSNLHAAGDELAALALKSPGNYLQALSDLKLIAENKMNSTRVRSSLEEIQKAFWAVLPREAPSPTQRGLGSHSLDVKFLEQLKTKAND